MEGVKSWFGNLGRRKTPQEIISRLHSELKEYLAVAADATALAAMKAGPQPNAVSQMDKRLGQMKEIMTGDDSKPPATLCVSLAAELQKSGIVLQLLQSMELLQFEARKDWVTVFISIVRNNYSNFVDYLKAPENHTILYLLIDGYRSPTTALNCGAMIRECIRHEEIAFIVLNSDKVADFFNEYIVMETFDVSSDAFLTVKDLLQRHTKIVANYLDPEGPNYIDFFHRYETLVNSDNYVTKRQALKLLGELLLDRINFKVMMAYINDKNNLRLIMNVLRSTSTAIQFEAFHIFKVFVANPKKTIDIATVLYQNQAKIIAFLGDFCTDKEDEQFNEEKQLLIMTLKNLKNPVAA